VPPAALAWYDAVTDLWRALYQINWNLGRPMQDGHNDQYLEASGIHPSNTRYLSISVGSDETDPGARGTQHTIGRHSICSSVISHRSATCSWRTPAVRQSMVRKNANCATRCSSCNRADHACTCTRRSAIRRIPVKPPTIVYRLAKWRLSRIIASMNSSTCVNPSRHSQRKPRPPCERDLHVIQR